MALSSEDVACRLTTVQAPRLAERVRSKQASQLCDGFLATGHWTTCLTDCNNAAVLHATEKCLLPQLKWSIVLRPHRTLRLRDSPFAQQCRMSDRTHSSIPGLLLQAAWEKRLREGRRQPQQGASLEGYWMEYAGFATGEIQQWAVRMTAQKKTERQSP